MKMLTLFLFGLPHVDPALTSNRYLGVVWSDPRPGEEPPSQGALASCYTAHRPRPNRDQRLFFYCGTELFTLVGDPVRRCYCELYN